MRKLIHPDGTEIPFEHPQSMQSIAVLLGAGCCDHFNLRDDGEHVVIVDDQGHAKGLPMNSKGTELYRKVTKDATVFVIRGPVFVCPDSDFSPRKEAPC